MLPRQQRCHFLLNITASFLCQQLLWGNTKLKYLPGVTGTHVDLSVHPSPAFLLPRSDRTTLVNTRAGPRAAGPHPVGWVPSPSSSSPSLKPRSKILAQENLCIQRCVGLSFFGYLLHWNPPGFQDFLLCGLAVPSPAAIATYRHAAMWDIIFLFKIKLTLAEYNLTG